MVSKLIMGILLVLAGGLLVYGGLNQAKTPNDIFPIAPGITNFEQCKAAGYLIQYSYPERCSVPGGPSFVQVLATGCASDAECTLGYFCKSGLCTEFSPETSCNTDVDCQLIDTTQRFSCCYAGACDIIDHSNPKWKAVNAQWFNENRTQYCPSQNECGPQPGCPNTIQDDRYYAVCENGLCAKKFV